VKVVDSGGPCKTPLGEFEGQFLEKARSLTCRGYTDWGHAEES